MSAKEANIAAILGASGSGKSTTMLRLITARKPKRLIVWNQMQRTTKYPGEEVTRLADLIARAEAAGKRGSLRVVFVPSRNRKIMAQQFEVVCDLAREAGCLWFVVEELKFVTSPSYAPMAWAEVTLTGRQYGLSVFGLTQRPASIDKDFFANCTVIRTGRLAYPEDVRVLAAAMDVSKDDLLKLRDLEWIEKDKKTGAVTAGKLVF